ncbi:hypothetical protein COV11_01985 [Candidatus Woesearchaeota archaeon CG10_big_fil_rev_8_21_14_0_10_30_7]|nr:MAG: hypothetical protein COV11_01985 [Candidatus Woesearchaeota archaeon CG10_big_fil_rev_8_21_14_0_10_30_7]
MKYLIFGNGWLGKKFQKYLLFSNTQMTDINISNKNQIKIAIDTYKPEIVINCAGKTGRPNIDWCEENKIATFSSNVIGPFNLAEICSKEGIKLVHLSSGCIYEGDNNCKGFSEEDKPNFFGSYYSKTKILAEEILSEFDVLQLRLRMPIDEQLGERSLVSKLLKYEKIISLPNSVTIIEDLLYAAKRLIDKEKTGIYNITNPGIITHEEIMNLYKEMVDPSLKFEIFSLEKMLKITKAERSNCILNTNKLQNEGIHLPEIHLRLREIFEEYKKNKKESEKALKHLKKVKKTKKN